jgi:hypothetical protein
LKLNSGLVGCSFFDFFNGFLAFLAIIFSLARFAQLGTAALICKALAKVQIHFSGPRKSIFVGRFGDSAAAPRLPQLYTR